FRPPDESSSDRLRLDCRSRTGRPQPKTRGSPGRGRRLESGWEISYNGALRCVHPDLVVIRSRRALMSRLPLTPDQAALADRIYQSLRQAADSDLRTLADLLAS